MIALEMNEGFLELELSKEKEKSPKNVTNRQVLKRSDVVESAGLWVVIPILLHRQTGVSVSKNNKIKCCVKSNGLNLFISM